MHYVLEENFTLIGGKDYLLLYQLQWHLLTFHVKPVTHEPPAF